MAGLDPVRFATPRGGSFLVAIDREIAGAWEAVTSVIHTTFADASGGGAVTLRTEVTSRKPTVDPAVCL
jgi:hypothetical protein